MENLQISLLGNHYENFISEKIREGKYSDIYEVLKSALQLLEKKERNFENLNFLLEEGEKSGYAENFEPQLFLNEMKTKYGGL